jgi:hypothetical protein
LEALIMTINLRTVVNLKTIALALSILCLSTAREASAGNNPGLRPTDDNNDAASASPAQAARAAKRRRHSRSNKKQSRRSRAASAAQPATVVASPQTPADARPATRTDIQPAMRDDAEENGRTPGPTPTPSLEQQFPKTYKIKKP